MILFGPRIEKRSKVVMLTDRRELLIIRRQGPGGTEVVLSERARHNGHWRLAKPLCPIHEDCIPELVAALTGDSE